MKMDGDRGTDTRERLLHAAGEVFAQSGFRATTVREIARQANANVAAINYHFGDKKGLYAEVLKSTLGSALRKYPPDMGLKDGDGPEAALHAFVRSLLFRVLDGGRPAWHGRLMAREISEPTSALDQLVNEAIRPLHERLRLIVRQLAGDGATDEQVRLCMACIFGQCLYYYHARPVLVRLNWPEPGMGSVERLAEHITRFSSDAIRAMRNGMPNACFPAGGTGEGL